MTWQQVVRERLQALGSGNWVVVCEAAYPLQVAPGLEALVAGDGLPQVLGFVLEQLRESPHLRPVLWVSEELGYVGEDSAPGVDELVAQLDRVLVMEELECGRELHVDLADRLRRVADQLRVLLIKSTTPLPYASVFVELQCAYWDADREEALRQRMVEEGR